MFAKYSAATVLAIASLAGFVAANSGSCTAARPVVNSVPYCNEVQHIRYKNVVSPGGSYELVTHMDPDTCACEKSVGTFSGALAPLDEDVSLSFYLDNYGLGKQFLIFGIDVAAFQRPLGAEAGRCILPRWC